MPGTDDDIVEATDWLDPFDPDEEGLVPTEADLAVGASNVDPDPEQVG
jgi:hypothetical protein